MGDESPVPCRAPYSVPRLNPTDEMAILCVGSDSNKAQLEVPLYLLQEEVACPPNQSVDRPFPRQHNNNTAQRALTTPLFRKVFYLPNTRPIMVRVFIDFLTHGEIHLGALPALDIVDLFNFANLIEAQSFRNAILDKFLRRITRHPSAIPFHLIPKIYATTNPHSSLRHVLVDVILNTAPTNTIRAWGTSTNLPAQFWQDCEKFAKEQEFVPDEDRRPWEWVKEKEERFCEEDHLHDRAGELVTRYIGETVDCMRGMIGKERREHERVLEIMETEAEERMAYFLEWEHTRFRY
ncbi:hypothetical protein T440DRAFT_540420 [Plenodomus tracheiphilus IPT5]|uniref:BTB domain-containing protein n=1 Tax=Plenodomus tracheiphilus IPT5 TaxID=1408161 RepID=A0A6A7AVW0_9PLEO|nr:hypothetical protein T440DRAFT_540420 [Plenodomus tracheiphilus IPT5]